MSLLRAVLDSFAGMRVRTRLMLAVVFSTFLLAGAGLYGVTRLIEVREIAYALRGSHAEAYLAVGRLQARLTEVDRFLRGYVITADPQHRARVRRAMGEARVEWARLGTAGYGQVLSDPRWLEKLTDAIKSVEELVAEGLADEATAALDDVIPLLDAGNPALAGAAGAIDSASAASVEDAQRISVAATRTMLLAVLFSLGIALGLGLRMTGAVTAPLGRLRDAMARVAGGEFVTPPDLPYRRGDEIGDLARSFRFMSAQLAELDRLKTELISVIGHDLKTPLNLISGYTELVEEGWYGEMTPEQREMLVSIREQTRLLGRLVNQLTNLSRLESGTFRLQLRPVAPKELRDGLRRAFSVMARQREIDFKVELARSAPAVVEADEEVLYNEVFYNLLSNAFKFTSARGKVVVRFEGGPNELRITVRDTGEGIPPQELPFIFDKFYRVSGNARSEGAGLGLAIVRQVVEAHGGWIRAESEPGDGDAGRGFVYRQIGMLPAGSPSRGGMRNEPCPVVIQEMNRAEAAAAEGNGFAGDALKKLAFIEAGNNSLTDSQHGLEVIRLGFEVID
jgi:signal transduction histidine kinase